MTLYVDVLPLKQEVKVVWSGTTTEEDETQLDSGLAIYLNMENSKGFKHPSV